MFWKHHILYIHTYLHVAQFIKFELCNISGKISFLIEIVCFSSNCSNSRGSISSPNMYLPQHAPTTSHRTPPVWPTTKSRALNFTWPSYISGSLLRLTKELTRSWERTLSLTIQFGENVMPMWEFLYILKTRKICRCQPFYEKKCQTLGKIIKIPHLASHMQNP